MIDKQKAYDKKFYWLHTMGLFDQLEIEILYGNNYNSYADYIDEWYENQK